MPEVSQNTFAQVSQDSEIPGSEIARNHQESAAQTAGARELVAFLKRSLDVTQRELDQTLQMQAEAAGRLSQHVMALLASLPEQTGQDAAHIISAIQSEDRIRQRYQGLALALSDLVTVLEEVEIAGMPASGGDAESLIKDCERWTARLLESQTLEELQETFALALTAD